MCLKDLLKMADVCKTPVKRSTILAMPDSKMEEGEGQKTCRKLCDSQALSQNPGL